VKIKFLPLVLALIALGAASLVVAQTVPIRQPLGIYFRMQIKQEADAQVTNSVMTALSNNAVSGILAVFAWNNLSFASTNPMIASNNFQLVDDVFGTVEQWNSTNPSNPKTIQLEITPGFSTPPWIISNLPSCDGLFLTNPVDGSIVDSNAQQGLFLVGVNQGFTNTNCGCATFFESESAGQPHLAPLPLPWNPFYKSAWQSFIQAVAAKYETNPILVSVAIDGPTASTAEMILPNEKNDSTNYLKWNPLFGLEFTNADSITNTDAVFITEWEDEMLLTNASFQIGEIAELGLSAEPAGQNVQLSWLASAAPTQLQVNHDISNSNGWKTAPQTPTRSNSFFQISLDPKANQSFYRLATPLTPPSQ
jgi:hypothetical protein